MNFIIAWNRVERHGSNDFSLQLPTKNLEALMSVPVSFNKNRRDGICWKHTDDGSFSISSVYEEVARNVRTQPFENEGKW